MQFLYRLRILQRVTGILLEGKCALGEPQAEVEALSSLQTDSDVARPFGQGEDEVMALEVADAGVCGIILVGVFVHSAGLAVVEFRLNAGISQSVQRIFDQGGHKVAPLAALVLFRMASAGDYAPGCLRCLIGDDRRQAVVLVGGIVVARQHLGAGHRVIEFEVGAVPVLHAVHLEVSPEFIVAQKRGILGNDIGGIDVVNVGVVGQAGPEAEISVVGVSAVFHQAVAGHECAGTGADVASSALHEGPEIVASRGGETPAVVGGQASVDIDYLISRRSVGIEQDAVEILSPSAEKPVLDHLVGIGCLRGEHSLGAQFEIVGDGHRHIVRHLDAGIHQKVLVEGFVWNVGADDRLFLRECAGGNRKAEECGDEGGFHIGYVCIIRV